MSDKLKQLAAKIEEAVTGAITEAYFPDSCVVDLSNGYSVHVQEGGKGWEYTAILYVRLVSYCQRLNPTLLDSEDELIAQVKEWAQLEPVEV